LIGNAKGKAYTVDGEKIYCIARGGDLLWTQHYAEAGFITETMKLAINSRGELIACFGHGLQLRQ